MGEIEERGRKRKKKRDIKRFLLAAVQTSALVGAAIAMPNLPSALYKMGLMRIRGDTNTISRARSRFIKQRILTKDANGHLHLTDKGRRELWKMELQDRPKKRIRWDGRWRILVFDIPERRRSDREKIRRSLHAIGFMRLQDSVWIYPYDCEDFITLLKADLRIGKDVLYMVVDELEGDTWVKDYFSLSSRR